MSKELETSSSAVYHDGEAGSDTVVGEKGGTLKDVEDMKRMGKEQLFKVLVSFRSSPRYPLMDDCIEKFWLPDHFRLCYDPYADVASTAWVIYSRGAKASLYSRVASIEHLLLAFSTEALPASSTCISLSWCSSASSTFLWLRWRQWRQPLVS